MHIDIVADVICPWCFIGKRRLERALALRADLIATLSWRAFELNPEMPSAGISREFYLSAKFGASELAERLYANIRAAGRSVGIDFAFERIHRVPNTLRAHRLIHLATNSGRGDAMVESLFRAYFIEGLDTGNIDTLADVASHAGLDRGSARRYLTSDAGTAEVRGEQDRAHRLGIHAVPCFVLDHGYAISGAQEPEIFLPLFDLAIRSSGRAATWPGPHHSTIPIYGR